MKAKLLPAEKKLRDYALGFPGAKEVFPRGSRAILGRYGWVTGGFVPGACVPIDLLFGYVDESYRAIAPKRLVAEFAVR